MKTDPRQFVRTLVVGAMLVASGAGRADEIPRPGPAVTSTIAVPDDKPINVFELSSQGGKLQTEVSKSGDQFVLPEWTSHPRSVSSAIGEQTLWFSSGRFATLDEALQAGWPQVQQAVQKDLAVTAPQAKDWVPSQQNLWNAGCLLSEAQVTWPLEVGGFTEEVKQVYWRIRLNSEIRERLLKEARPVIVRERLGMLNVAFGLVGLGFGVVAWRGRRRESTR